MHLVVTNLMQGLHNTDYVVAMDNYLTSVGLFKELASLGTYAMGTLRVTHTGIPQQIRTSKH